MRRRIPDQAILVAYTILALGVLAAPAQAQDFDCSKPEDLPQMGLTWCAGQEFQKTDAELNALWPKLMADAKARDADSADFIKDLGVPTTQQALRAAQRAWIDFRDRQCELESYEALGGSMQPMLAESCKADMTRKRIEALSTLFDDTGR